MYASERTHIRRHVILYLQQVHRHVGAASLALMLPRAVRREVEDPQPVPHRLRPESGRVGGRAGRAVSRGVRRLLGTASITRFKAEIPRFKPT